MNFFDVIAIKEILPPDGAIDIDPCAIGGDVMIIDEYRGC
jgi:hypothetical protein